MGNSGNPVIITCRTPLRHAWNRPAYGVGFKNDGMTSILVTLSILSLSLSFFFRWVENRLFEKKGREKISFGSSLSLFRFLVSRSLRFSARRSEDRRARDDTFDVVSLSRVLLTPWTNFHGCYFIRGGGGFRCRVCRSPASSFPVVYVIAFLLGSIFWLFFFFVEGILSFFFLSFSFFLFCVVFHNRVRKICIRGDGKMALWMDIYDYVLEDCYVTNGRRKLRPY